MRHKGEAEFFSVQATSSAADRKYRSLSQTLSKLMSAMSLTQEAIHLGSGEPIYIYPIRTLDICTCLYIRCPHHSFPSNPGYNRARNQRSSWLHVRIMPSHVYDVIVVGGGAIGLGAAYEVAKAGKSILVLEQSCLFNTSGSSNDLARMYRTM